MPERRYENDRKTTIRGQEGYRKATGNQKDNEEKMTERCQEDGRKTVGR